MADEDENEKKCMDALEKDFAFDVELAKERVDCLPDPLDRQKVRRWINRLKLEPTYGHTNDTRRVRNSYIKLLLVNLINGAPLEPRLDIEPPPPNVGFCELKFLEQNDPPEWLDKFDVGNESCKVVDAGGEGQCYISGKTFEDGGACGYVALTTGKDDWLTAKKDSPGFTIKKRKRKPHSISSSICSGDEDQSRTCPPTRGDVLGGPITSTPMPMGEPGGTRQGFRSPGMSSISFGEFRPTLLDNLNQWEDGEEGLLPLDVRLQFEPCTYYGINPVVEEKIQELLPRSLIIEFREGLYDVKEAIRTQAVKKLKEKVIAALRDAKSITKTTINDVLQLKHEVYLLTTANQKLRCARRYHLARVKELERRATDNGFAGIIKCDYTACLLQTIQDLEDEKSALEVDSEHLEQEWNSIKVRLSLKDLKEAVDGATEEVKEIISKPRCKESKAPVCIKSQSSRSSCGSCNR